MKNIYFVQPNNSLSNAVYLPYAAGTIAAYAFAQKDIRESCRLGDFIFLPKPIEEALAECTDPFVAAFSCYMWNYEYNLAFAQAVKEKYPSCTVIFGGPQIPDDTTLLQENPFIDFSVHGEGETVVTQLLLALLQGGDFASIHNIAFRTDEGICKTPRSAPPSLENHPSPYTTGIFDRILNDVRYAGMQFDATVETNRGCPYGCIYCYWARTGSSFRSFPLERIKKDIEWLGTHKIAYCVCADGNFGILERDEEIVEHVIAVKKKYGFPQRFETTSAKNKDEVTFRINRKLEQSGLNRGVSVAVQSMCEDTLKIIGRKNMSVNNLAEQLQKYRSHNIDTYTDLILGLPGETLESFCRGLFAVLEAGQHYSVNINRCEVLPNTILYSPQWREKYRIRTIRSQLCQNHSRLLTAGAKASRSEIVVQTSTMSRDDWKTALQIGACTQGFHCMGLLRFIAIYLRKAKNISYYDFYMQLIDWIFNNGQVSKQIITHVFSCLDAFLREEGNLFFADERFGDIYWAFEEGIFLSVVYEVQAFYEDIRGFLSSYFDDRALFEDLLAYQQAVIARPAMPVSERTFRYAWNRYFDSLFDDAVIQPEQCETHLRITPPETDSWQTFAREVVWFGRRNGRMINKTQEV